MFCLIFHEILFTIKMYPTNLKIKNKNFLVSSLQPLEFMDLASCCIFALNASFSLWFKYTFKLEKTYTTILSLTNYTPILISPCRFIRCD